MKTIGYILISLGVLLLWRASKGRIFEDGMKDAGDIFVGLVTGDNEKIAEAAARTGPPVNTSTSSSSGNVADSGVESGGGGISVMKVTSNTTSTKTTGGGGSGKGMAVLSAMKSLGSGKPYIWGGTGPNGYDCSGLVWAAMRQTGVYSGGRFTTYTFRNALGSKITQVSSPAPGDIVLWSAHMGVAEGGGSYFSALSSKSGIRSASISAHGSTPTYWRLV